MASQGRGGGRGGGGRRFRPQPGFAGGGQPAKALPQVKLKQARTSGRLNLSASNLQAFPADVLRLDELLEETDKWWESIPLQQLDLCMNFITAIPDEIDTLSSLVSLKLAHNQLPALPHGICGLAELKLLDASHNQLTKLPDAIACLRAIVQLDINDNRISLLPDGLQELSTLEVLHANNNALRSIPTHLERLANLSELTLNNNTITHLPASIGNCRNLKTLEVRKNQLRSLPDELRHCANLQLLDCRENALTALPEFAPKPKLSQLFLGFNKLSELRSEQVERCISLEVLDVSNNQLRELPAAVAALSLLHTLDVSNNDLSDIPYQMGYLSTLKRISLEGNPLRSIRRSLVSGGWLALQKYLRSRDPRGDIEEEALSKQAAAHATTSSVRKAAVSGTLEAAGRGWSAIPASMFEDAELLEATHTITMANNRLSVLPKDIQRFAALTDLNMDNNQLTTLPPHLALLPLASISMQRNKLSTGALNELHIAESKLPHSLQHLNLANNALRALPAMVPNCGSLRLLDLSFNGMSTCPEMALLTWLPQLETLNVSNNRLSAVPVQPVLMPQLTSLNISNNNIRQLPPELGLATQLRALLLDGNPQKSVRHNIIAQGTVALLDYLASRVPAGTTIASIRAASDAAMPATSALAPSGRVTPPPAARPAAGSDTPSGAGAGAGAAGSSYGSYGGGPSSVFPAAANTAAVTVSNASVIADLRASIEDLETQMQRGGLSQAKQFAVKKQIARARASLIREERKAKNAAKQ